MRQINYIVVHCSATEDGKEYFEKDIESWHAQRFKKLGGKHIGYHYIIYLDGTIQQTKPISIMGQHVSGFNAKSIGICYIGGLKNGNAWDTRTLEQKESLKSLLSKLKKEYPDAEIKGHRDFQGVRKDCPCFDAKSEYKNI